MAKQRWTRNAPKVSGGDCGRCKKPMPTERRTLKRGDVVRFFCQGSLQPKFFIGIESMEVNYCVRCSTYTPIPIPATVQSQ